MTTLKLPPRSCPTEYSVPVEKSPTSAVRSEANHSQLRQGMYSLNGTR